MYKLRNYVFFSKNPGKSYIDSVDMYLSSLRKHDNLAPSFWDVTRTGTPKNKRKSCNQELCRIGCRRFYSTQYAEIARFRNWAELCEDLCSRVCFLTKDIIKVKS